MQVKERYKTEASAISSTRLTANEEIDEDETPADLGMEDQDEIETSFDNEEILEDETPADLGMEDQDEIVCKVLEVTKDHC